METQRYPVVPSIGLVILRVGMGALMAAHGWGKVQMAIAGQGAQFPDLIGVGSTVSLWLALAAEFGCAILVIVGLLTRLAAVPPVVAMTVAAFMAHANDPWTMGEGARLFAAGEAATWASKEPALLYLTGFLTLVFTGAGRFSLDFLWARRRSMLGDRRLAEAERAKERAGGK